MKTARKAVTMAAALCCATQAFAGSVSQPGQTIGLAVGTPVPDGVYFFNTFDFGRRSGAG